MTENRNSLRITVEQRSAVRLIRRMRTRLTRRCLKGLKISHFSGAEQVWHGLI